MIFDDTNVIVNEPIFQKSILSFLNKPIQDINPNTIIYLYKGLKLYTPLKQKKY